MIEKFDLDNFIMQYETEEEAADEHLSIYYDPYYNHNEGDEDEY